MERYFDHKSGMTFISVAPLKVASKRAMQAKSKTGKRWIVVVSHQYRDAIGEQIVANYRERTVFIDKSRFAVLLPNLGIKPARSHTPEITNNGK